MKNNFLLILKRSILAGICIALGSAIFLKVGGIIGAIMFAFGLLTVVHFKIPLYTGTAGFIKLKSFHEWLNMLYILLGNIIGCILFGFMPIDGIQEGANAIIQSRIDAGYSNCFLRAIGCGIIMTFIVQAGRDHEIYVNGVLIEGRPKNLLLILFGIPLFILLGFYHSIADAAYFAYRGQLLSLHELYISLTIVSGNFVGCNIPRLFKYI